MKAETRRTMIAAYKERKAPPGIYAIRCTLSGESWIGYAADLDSIANRIWFSLKLGRYGDRTLQAAWNRHGRENFVLETLERFDDDLADFERAKLSRDRQRYWQDQLAARPA